jgi:putative heme-binding domain-containing protein
MRTATILFAAAALLPAQPNDVSEGKRLFIARCAGCHGAYGEGGRGAALNTGNFRHGGANAELFQTIRNGVPNTEMPASNMPDADVERIVGFIKQLGQASSVASGDPAAGKAVYARAGCGSCHLVNGEGSDLGPELSRIGMRPAAFLRDSIVEPDKDVNFNYLAVNVTTVAGAKVRGVFLNEDEYSIQMRDGKGNPRSFLKRNLRDFHHEKVSLMPASPSVSGADLDNLVAYLSTLKAAR